MQLKKNYKNNCKIWVLTDGRAGMVNPALGLAEALADILDGNVKIIIKTIKLSKFLVNIPPVFWLPFFYGDKAIINDCENEKPDVIISSGRHAVGVNAYLKRKYKDNIFTIHIQHPRVNFKKFDLVVIPKHDKIRNITDNLIISEGSLHRITNKKLDEFINLDKYKKYSKLCIGVLFGGSNKIYDLNSDLTTKIAKSLEQAIDKINGSIFLTTSRRTGAKNIEILRKELTDNNNPLWGEIWYFNSINKADNENPYFEYLANCDILIVTGDSVNMVSEAMASGKPTYIIKLPTNKKSKFDLFYDLILKNKRVRLFNIDSKNELEQFSVNSYNETIAIAEKIKKCFIYRTNIGN